MTESDIKTMLDDLLDKLLNNPQVLISKFKWKDEFNNVNIFFNSLDYKGLVVFFQNCAYRPKFKHLLELSISDDQFRNIVEYFLWTGYRRFGYTDSFIYLIDSCFGKETDSLSREIQNLFLKLNEDAQESFFCSFIFLNNYEYSDIYESNIQEEINNLSIQFYPDKYRIGYLDAYLNNKAIMLSSYESALKRNAKKNYLRLFQIRLEIIIILIIQVRKRKSNSRIPQEVKYLEEMYFLLEEIDRELYSYTPPANIELIKSIIIKIDAFYTSKIINFTNTNQASRTSIAIAAITNETLVLIFRDLDFSQGGVSESLWIHRIKPILIDYGDFKKSYAYLPYTNPEEELAYQLKPFNLTIEELDQFYNKIETENISLKDDDISLLFSGQKNTNEILKRYINNSNYNLPEAISRLKGVDILLKTFKNRGFAALGVHSVIFSFFNIQLPGISQSISILLDFSPIGTLKGIVEAVVGVDIITGEKLELWERLLGAVPVPFGEISKIVKSTGKSAAKKSVALAIVLSLKVKVKKIPPSKALRIINKIENVDIGAINKASEEIKNSSKVVNGKLEIPFSETQATARNEILKVANELAHPPVKPIPPSNTVVKTVDNVNDSTSTSGKAISDRGDKTPGTHNPSSPGGNPPNTGTPDPARGATRSDTSSNSGEGLRPETRSTDKPATENKGVPDKPTTKPGEPPRSPDHDTENNKPDGTPRQTPSDSANELTHTGDRLRDAVVPQVALPMQRTIVFSPSSTSMRRVIHGINVTSWMDNILVGKTTRAFRRDVLKIIKSDTNHPLRGMFENGRFVRMPGSNQAEWAGDPRYWQAGHVKSKKARGEEYIVIMSTHYNQKLSRTQERGVVGRMAINEAVVVGGIAIHKATLIDLIDHGFVDSSVLHNATIIDFSALPL